MSEKNQTNSEKLHDEKEKSENAGSESRHYFSRDSLHSYWKESERPLISLAFVTPMLLFYEGGMLLLGAQALRNGADVWLRQFLNAVGFGQYFLLPLLTCSGLLAWHHTTRQQWRISPSVLYGMFLESAVFGFLLLILASSFSRSMAAAIPCDLASQTVLNINRLVGYVGAGLYEELLFRLMLLPTSAYIFRLFGMTRKSSLVSAAIITSFIFSAAHYELFTSYGDVFQWYTFSFRMLAGLFFSVLFIYRGFGITAGVHALYDIFTLI